MVDDGIEKFFKDIGVIDVESDIVVFSVSKYMGAQQMGCYTEGMFKQGCETL